MKRQKITITEYNKIIDKVIRDGEKRNLQVHEMLIEMLEVAGGYDIKDDSKKRRNNNK